MPRTEVGCANVYIPRYINPLDWEWFSKQHHVVLAPQEDGDAVEFQLLVSNGLTLLSDLSYLTERPLFLWKFLQPCETHSPVVLNTKIDGKDGYSTSDLILPHPTKPGYYKIHGRADDQIMSLAKR